MHIILISTLFLLITHNLFSNENNKNGRLRPYRSESISAPHKKRPLLNNPFKRRPRPKSTMNADPIDIRPILDAACLATFVMISENNKENSDEFNKQITHLKNAKNIDNIQKKITLYEKLVNNERTSEEEYKNFIMDGLALAQRLANNKITQKDDVFYINIEQILSVCGEFFINNNDKQNLKTAITLIKDSREKQVKNLPYLITYAQINRLTESYDKMLIK